MKCTTLLLPFVAGLVCFAQNISAKSLVSTTNAKTNNLSFLENKGQIINQHQVSRKDLDFKLSAGNGLNIFIGSGKVEYQWTKIVPLEIASHPFAALQGVRNDGDGVQEEESYELYRMDVSLIGANANARVIKEEAQSYYERYYLPAFPEAGAIARSYRKITYKDIYPHIDWVFYFNAKGQLEHDFVIRPGGKASDIQIRYGGATALSVLDDGGLQAITPLGSLKEHVPYSYDAEGRVVTSRFVLDGNVLSFAVGDYSGTLTIDPTLEWGTFYGDLAYEQAYGLCVDSIGNSYMVGGVSSLDNIATTGSYQSTYGGSNAIMGDAFMIKFSPKGERLWATYYGGLQEDRATSIVVDPVTQKLYIAGSTQSVAGMASAGAHQTTHAGNFDAFLAQFDADGKRIWSTYYGGSGNDGSNYFSVKVAADKKGNVWLIGDTNSPSGIATPGSQQPNSNAAIEVFVVKFDQQGQRIWGTYLGGAMNDLSTGLVCDGLGNLYITGNTLSTSGFGTAGVYQTANGGAQDGFLSKFTESGTLAWSTFFGGPLLDQSNTVTFDGTNVYIAGNTRSKTGIASPGSYQDTHGGGTLDCFLSKFSNTGQLIWATYYGGAGGSDAMGAAVYAEGSVFVAGGSNSNHVLASPDAYQDTLNGASADAFIARFDTSGLRTWGTYYGGVGTENVNAMAIDHQQGLYIAGGTRSTTNISTPGSYQEAYGGGDNDIMLVKFNLCDPPSAPDSIFGPTVLCSGQEYKYYVDSIAGGLRYNWRLPVGWLGHSDTVGIGITPDTASGRIWVSVSNHCTISDSIALDILVYASPQPEILQNGPVLNTTKAYTTYQWLLNGAAIEGATASSYLVAVNGAYAVSVEDGNGCTGVSDTLHAGSVSISRPGLNRDRIKIYPNPALSKVQIQATAPVVTQVKSIEGRVVLAPTTHRTIDISRLPRGLYLIQVYSVQQELLYTEKLVKQ